MPRWIMLAAAEINQLWVECLPPGAHHQTADCPTDAQVANIIESHAPESAKQE